MEASQARDATRALHRQPHRASGNGVPPWPRADSVGRHGTAPRPGPSTASANAVGRGRPHNTCARNTSQAGLLPPPHISTLSTTTLTPSTT